MFFNLSLLSYQDFFSRRSFLKRSKRSRCWSMVCSCFPVSSEYLSSCAVFMCLKIAPFLYFPTVSFRSTLPQIVHLTFCFPLFSRFSCSCPVSGRNKSQSNAKKMRWVKQIKKFLNYLIIMEIAKNPKMAFFLIWMQCKSWNKKFW